MRSPSFEWKDESVAELRRLWCEKGASAGVAAQLLSEKFGGYVTRNMIIGKAHRLGLKHPEGRIAVAPRQKKTISVVKQSLTTQPAKIIRQSPNFPPCLQVVLEYVEHEPETPSDGSTLIGLLDLRETTCRFPIGDPRHESFGYCGAPSLVGKPYCKHHHRIAYVRHQPSVSRKKNGDHHGARVVQLA